LNTLKKIELVDTEAAKGNYREQLFKLIKGLETVDGKNNQGEEVDSTIYEDEDEGDEFDDDGEDGEFDEEGDFEDDEDFDDEDEEEDEKPQKGKKQRKE
jgi:hypothetical protein